MKLFKNARQSFVNTHYTWAEHIFKDMRDINNALKDYKYAGVPVKELGINAR